MIDYNFCYLSQYSLFPSSNFSVCFYVSFCLCCSSMFSLNSLLILGCLRNGGLKNCLEVECVSMYGRGLPYIFLQCASQIWMGSLWRNLWCQYSEVFSLELVRFPKEDFSRCLCLGDKRLIASFSGCWEGNGGRGWFFTFILYIFTYYTVFTLVPCLHLCLCPSVQIPSCFYWPQRIPVWLFDWIKRAVGRVPESPSSWVLSKQAFIQFSLFYLLSAF